MKENNNLTFLPNIGKNTFRSSTDGMVDDVITQQYAADHPSPKGLNNTYFRHSASGMVPIANKKNR